MPPTFEDYCRRLQREADARTREADGEACSHHLQAFNFGRTVGRMEIARHTFGRRLRWLLCGVAVGVVLAAVSLQIFLSERVMHFAK